MQGNHFGDDTFADELEEACRIVTELAALNEASLPREIAALIQRARAWRMTHVSTVD